MRNRLWIFATFLFLTVSLALPADMPLGFESGWGTRDNGTHGVVAEEGMGPVLKFSGDFNKVAYAWAKVTLPKGQLDPARFKGLAFSVKGENINSLGITLVWREGGQEVKYTKEIRVSGSWKRQTIPLIYFMKGETAISAEQLTRVEAIMFNMSRAKAPTGVLYLSALQVVESLPKTENTTVVIENGSGDLKWKGAVTRVAAPGRPLQQALRFDASVPDGMATEDFPHDWSAANALVADIYSEQETGAQVELILPSKMAGADDFSYFRQTLKVNWKGWRTVEWPFAKFSPNRKPAGFQQIDAMQWVVDGWGHKPVAGTILYFGPMEARLSTNRTPGPEPIRVTEQHLRDLALIKARATEVMIPDLTVGLRAMGDSVEKNLASLGEDGSWADVNYNDRARALWSPATHLDRVSGMAITWVRMGVGNADGSLRKKLKDGIDRALAFWFQRDPQSENWWHNVIGCQLTLCRIGLALDPYLTPEQRAAIVKIFLRSNPDGMTGGNLTWTAGNTVVRACLENNPEAAARAFMLIAAEVRMADGDEEGVKIDGSFHQHGQQVYNSGYGSVYAMDASRFLFYAAGTAYAFPKEKGDVLATYALDGSRWMLYRNIFDYSARGREVTRVSRGYALSYLVEVCKNLKTQPGPRQSDLEAFYRELTNKENSLVGNKHFWKSDYMVHRRPHFMASVKMLSSRMQSGELVNDEGKKSHLLSDGLSYLYTRDGLAYHNIFPLWDWKRLPGITAAYSPDAPTGSVPSRGETSFAGGVSEGGFGACAFFHKRNGLEAKKSYFFFDDEMVALGSGIQGPGDEVNTTLDQSLKTGEVVVSLQGKETAASGETRFEHPPQFVHHRGLGFVPLMDETMVLKLATQNGSWKEINGSASGAPLSAELMTLWVDHGKKSGGAYAYGTLFGSLEQTRAWAQKPPIQVVTNSPAVAAVEHRVSGVIQGVFYEAGGFRSSGDLVITTDGPAICMLRKTTGGFVLSAANPEGRGGVLGITINKKLSGIGASWEGSRGFTRIRLPFPDGDEAGKTVTVSFSGQP